LVNYQATLTRYLESYHIGKGGREKGHEGIKTIHEIEEELQIQRVPPVDWHPKNSFVCHLLTREPTEEEFYREELPEVGDFANRPFLIEVKKEGLLVKREGGVYLPERYPTTVLKLFRTDRRGLEIFLKLESSYRKELKLLVEFNLHLPAEKIHVRQLDRKLLFSGEGFNRIVAVETSLPFKLIYCPLKTVHKVEGGIEETFQGITAGLIFPFEGKIEINFRLEVSHVSA